MKDIINNISQAYKTLTVFKKDVVLICTYYERKETHTFKASDFKNVKPIRYIGFKHQIKCIKNDFKDISTFYRGNKKDCKFKWFLKEK